MFMLDDSLFICYYDNQAGIIMSVSKNSKVTSTPSILIFHFSYYICIENIEFWSSAVYYGNKAGIIIVV